MRTTFALAQQPEQSPPAAFADSLQAALALSQQDLSEAFLSSPACADTQATTARVSPRMSFFIRGICSPKPDLKQARKHSVVECAASQFICRVRQLLAVELVALRRVAPRRAAQRPSGAAHSVRSTRTGLSQRDKHHLQETEKRNGAPSSSSARSRAWAEPSGSSALRFMASLDLQLWTHIGTMNLVGAPDSDPARREGISIEPHRSAALRFMGRKGG